ncbi:hypothetical protein KA005_29830 [bacterium]|nr:hypothetical protein [bacterium]
MSNFFTSANDLKKAFSVEDRPEYIEFTPFNNEIGFNVKRAYPEESRFKAPVKKDGTPDTYALIGILYQPGRCSSIKPNIVPVSAWISVSSKFPYEHGDYDFSNAECPTEDSVLASKKTPRPVELTVFDQYAYDHNNDKFLDADDKIVEGISIIDDLFGNHLATVDQFKGLIFRWKLASRNKAGALYGTAIGIIKWLLRTICGRTLEQTSIKNGLWRGYSLEDMKLLKTESIDVFGYKASKNVIVTFCSLLLLGYSFIHWTPISFSWLTGVANNSLLAFAFSILLLSFLDHVLPKIFFLSINALNKRRWKTITASIKFK